VCLWGRNLHPDRRKGRGEKADRQTEKKRERHTETQKDARQKQVPVKNLRRSLSTHMHLWTHAHRIHRDLARTRVFHVPKHMQTNDEDQNSSRKETRNSDARETYNRNNRKQSLQTKATEKKAKRRGKKSFPPLHRETDGRKVKEGKRRRSEKAIPLVLSRLSSLSSNIELEDLCLPVYLSACLPVLTDWSSFCRPPLEM